MPRLKTIDVYPADHDDLGHPFSRLARVPALRLDLWLSVNTVTAPFSSYRLLLDQSHNNKEFDVRNDPAYRMGWLYDVAVPLSFGDLSEAQQREAVVSLFMRVLNDHADMDDRQRSELSKTLSVTPWEAMWTSHRFRLSDRRMATATFVVDEEGRLSGSLLVDGEDAPQPLTGLAPDLRADLAFFKALISNSPLSQLAWS